MKVEDGRCFGEPLHRQAPYSHAYIKTMNASVRGEVGLGGYSTRLLGGSLTEAMGISMEGRACLLLTDWPEEVGAGFAPLPLVVDMPIVSRSLVDIALPGELDPCAGFFESILFDCLNQTKVAAEGRRRSSWMAR